jgi:hypothetical protein
MISFDRLARAVALALALGLAFPATLSAQQKVDLELVLAIDVSSSVDDDEYFLQVYGLAQAFRHPDVVSAIKSSTTGGIVVSLVQWSDSNKQVLAVDWTPITDAYSALAFSETLLRTPRLVAGGQTSISGAIEFSRRLIDMNGYEGWRQTIDVSGDGRANSGPPPTGARDLAVEAGITINGLAVLNEEPFVDRYFEHSVIGGEYSFMIEAVDYDDFSAAMTEKLVREIGIPLAQRRTAPAGPIVLADSEDDQ